MCLGLFPHRAAKVRSGLAKGRTSPDKPVADQVWNRVAIARDSEMVAKAPPLPAFPDTRQANPEGLQDSPNLSFEVLSDVSACGADLRI